jgi:hypothetical protein
VTRIKEYREAVQQGTVVSAVYLGDRTYIRIAIEGVAAPVLSCLSGLPNADQFYEGRAVWVDLTGEHTAIAE